MPLDLETFDVVVVGSGNAGFAAAVSAAQTLSSSSASLSPSSSRVLLLDRCPPGWAGGNTTFTAGAYRTAHAGLASLLPLVRNVPPSLAPLVDLPPYGEGDFADDLRRVTSGRADPELAQELVGRSAETTEWLARECAIEFELAFHRQAYEIGGRHKFWGGLCLSVRDGGKGLTRMWMQKAEACGVEVRWESEVVGFVRAGDGRSVEGVEVRHADGGDAHQILARGGVVLAAGGFEASPLLRSMHLGQGWGAAYVRGTPHNTGSLLTLAIDQLGAARAGDWSGCHSTCWDANAPRAAGDRELTNQFTKSGYPLGIMVNVRGRRFVDEGLDMRNYTYAKFGREILRQEDSVAFQVWDSDGAAWLRKEEYDPGVVERIEADTLDGLASKMWERGLKDTDTFLREVREFNEAVTQFGRENPQASLDPSKKDGRSTRSCHGGLGLDKTNWAIAIEAPPFVAVKVTCGITFTFGGLKISPRTASVVSEGTWEAIPGLYCAGEMVGGLFFENYPGGSGLTSGAVFGRMAGAQAANRVLGKCLIGGVCCRTSQGCQP